MMSRALLFSGQDGLEMIVFMQEKSLFGRYPFAGFALSENIQNLEHEIGSWAVLKKKDLKLSIDNLSSFCLLIKQYPFFFGKKFCDGRS